MDPLSITAGVIAALQAAGVTAQGVEKAWRLRHIPRDFMMLKNELNDLQCLLLQVRDINFQPYEQTNCPTNTIAFHVERLRNYLEQLDDVVRKLTKPQGPGESDITVSYRRWVGARNHVAFLRSSIVQVRNNLSLSINATLALENRHMYRMLLHVQGLEVTDTSTLTEESTENPAEASTGEDSNDSDKASEPEEWFNAPSPQPLRVSHERTTSTSGIWQSRLLQLDDTNHAQAYHVTGTVGTASCDNLCPCRCHIRTPLKTPRWLRGLCGYLFSDHIIVPGLSRRFCNLSLCKQSGNGALRVSYIFPGWLVRRMLVLSMTWKDISGPGATWTIRMPRIVPYYAPIWEMIRFDRGLAVRQSLNMSRASSFDIRHDGTTLLYHAFCFRRWDIARFVLSQGGSMDWEDIYGRTPLSVALIAYHSLESTQHTKAEAYTFISGCDVAETLGFTPLHAVILQRRPYELQQYLHMDLTHLDARDNLGRTPLILAACHSNEQATRTLLKCGANSAITDRSGRCPLHYAAQRAQGIVQALVENCDERPSGLLEIIDERGRSALYFAIEFNQSEIFTYLCVRGLSLTIKDRLQRTLLHYAAWTGEAEVMNMLNQQDLSEIDLGALDSYGQTAQQCFSSLRHEVAGKTIEAFRCLVAAAR